MKYNRFVATDEDTVVIKKSAPKQISTKDGKKVIIKLKKGPVK